MGAYLEGVWFIMCAIVLYKLVINLQLTRTMIYCIMFLLIYREMCLAFSGWNLLLKLG